MQLTLLLLGLIASICSGRPLVRSIRNNAEFKRLLNYHKDVTGLPVIVDYYSDGCGPCRMIAPVYKDMAKRFKDQVVFTKVDVNSNRETSSMERIRSMPTFQFYMNGKKRHQFSGGDSQQLQMWATKLAREFNDNNVKVTRESLEAFYKEFAPEKATEETIEKVMTKAGGEGGGKGHRSLIKALKKKYGKGPEVVKRYDPENKKGSEDGENSKRRKTTSSSSPSSTPPPSANMNKPNLHLASVEELQQELEKRKIAEEEQKEEQDDEEDEDENDGENVQFQQWQPNEYGVPERVVIIGGGPAGLSSAIYASRAGLEPVVVAPPAGGQLQGKGVLVENYPAVVDSTGPAVVFEMQKQAAKYGALFIDDFVVDVQLGNKKGELHKISTNDTTILSHTVIIATGANTRWLEAEGEELYKGGGVSGCATCDGYLYKDQPVIVIGGGDTAMEEALHLAGTSSRVTIIHRGGEFNKASTVLANRVLNHEKIDIRWNTTVQSFQGRVETEEEMKNDPHVKAQGADFTEPEQPLLTHVVLKVNGQDELEDFPCQGAFIAIGHTPNTELFQKQLEMNKEGYLFTKHPSTQTSLESVFAAGDVADHIYRQAITSAGTGAAAAIDSERWLAENGIGNEKKEKEDEFMKELLEEIHTQKKDDDENCEEIN